jgi:hypothetical protein
MLDFSHLSKNKLKSHYVIVLFVISSFLSFSKISEAANFSVSVSTISQYYIGENYDFSSIPYTDNLIRIRLNDYIVDLDSLPVDRVKSTTESIDIYVWIQKTRENTMIIYD